MTVIGDRCERERQGFGCFISQNIIYVLKNNVRRVVCHVMISCWLLLRRLTH